jgi:hypothetical protein
MSISDKINELSANEEDSVNIGRGLFKAFIEHIEKVHNDAYHAGVRDGLRLQAAISAEQPKAPPSKDVATIYLMSPRKNWLYGSDLLETWAEIAWERFDFIECGIYQKPTRELTDNDKQLVESYSRVPDGWIEPSPR